MQNVVIKKLKRYFAAGVYLSEAQKHIPPPPPHTLCTCIQYTYSQGVGDIGGELNQREG
jgi:hypothetical protein